MTVNPLMFRDVMWCWERVWGGNLRDGVTSDARSDGMSDVRRAVDRFQDVKENRAPNASLSNNDRDILTREGGCQGTECARR